MIRTQELSAAFSQCLPHNEDAHAMLVDLCCMAERIGPEYHDATIHTYLHGYLRAQWGAGANILTIAALVEKLLAVVLPFVQETIANGRTPPSAPSGAAAAVSAGLSAVQRAGPASVA